LHPIGHAMAIGGVGLLGTQYEAPRRAIQSAKQRMPSFLKNRFSRMKSQDSSCSTEDSSDWCTPVESANSKRQLKAALQQALKRRQELEKRRQNSTVQFFNADENNNEDDDNTYEKDVQENLELIRQLHYQLEQWKKALQIEEELYGFYYCSPTSDSLVRAQSHNRIGYLHQQLRNYSTSHDHYMASLQCFECKIRPTYRYHADMGEAWNALAGLAVAEDKYDFAMDLLQQKAEPHFRHHGQLKMQQDDASEEQPHPEILKCLHNQVQLLQYMNQHETAQEIKEEVEHLSKVFSS